MMLMTYTSPELLPPTPESVEQVDLSVGRRHLKPDGDSAEDTQNTFELQFAHTRESLYFIADRILNCAEEAEEAVKNCHLTASCNPPGFSSEGAFKSWLVRILIDEATLLLRRRQGNSTASSRPLPEQVREHLPEGR
jgi:DNA-directed RNA polymerase specialized sigma24 family protein